MAPWLIRCTIVYLGSEIYSKGKLTEINLRIQNNSKYYQIIKRILWNREILKQCETKIYKIHFKLVLTFNPEMWILKEK
jgi:hypothetical protein